MTTTASAELEIGSLVTVARYPGVIYKIHALYDGNQGPQALILYASGNVGINPLHKDLSVSRLIPA